MSKQALIEQIRSLRSMARCPLFSVDRRCEAFEQARLLMWQARNA